MSSPLDRIAFLASSENRVAILSALNREPKDARDLQAITGASRATVGRALGDLEGFNWINRRNGVYEITPVGELVVEAFDALLDTMERVVVLEDVQQWLPVDEMALDPSELGDAEIVRPSDGNLTAHIDHGSDLVAAADSVTVVGNAVVPQYVELIRERVLAGELDSRHVYSGSAVDTLAEYEELEQQFRDIVTAGDRVWRYDCTIPYNFLVVDDRVLFFLCGEASLPEALLETDNEAVLAWARTTFETYRDDAITLDRGLTV